MCEHKTLTIIDDLRYCADCEWFIDEVCPTCKKEPLACRCPTINRGSFAKYVDEREGIYKILIDQNCYTDPQRLEWEKKVPDIILTYLHSQGYVRKVKCPDCAWAQFSPDEAVGMTPCYSCNSTGYITEPLIEES